MESSILSNPIYTELTATHKLTTDGTNFFSWKKKLELLLIQLSAQHVLKSPRPNRGSTQESVAAFNNWTKSDSLCRQIIFDTIHLDLSPFLYNLPTAKSYMDALQARFNTTPNQKIKLLKSYLHRPKMGTLPITQHVSTIGKETFDVEMAGFTVPEEIKIQVLKNSLSKSWKNTADGVIDGLDPEDTTFNIVTERLRRIGQNRPQSTHICRELFIVACCFLAFMSVPSVIFLFTAIK